MQLHMHVFIFSVYIYVYVSALALLLVVISWECKKIAIDETFLQFLQIWHLPLWLMGNGGNKTVPNSLAWGISEEEQPRPGFWVDPCTPSLQQGHPRWVSTSARNLPNFVVYMGTCKVVA